MESENGTLDSGKEDLIRLIATARENGLCIKSRYQSIYFTPEELEECHGNGKFLWFDISNWEAVTLPCACKTYTGKSSLDLLSCIAHTPSQTILSDEIKTTEQQPSPSNILEFVMITNLSNIKCKIFALCQEDAEYVANEMYRVLSIPYKLTGYSVIQSGII